MRKIVSIRLGFCILACLLQSRLIQYLLLTAVLARFFFFFCDVITPSPGSKICAGPWEVKNSTSEPQGHRGEPRNIRRDALHSCSTYDTQEALGDLTVFVCPFFPYRTATQKRDGPGARAQEHKRVGPRKAGSTRPSVSEPPPP